METEIWTIVVALLLTGLIGLAIALVLFNRFKKERIKGTLILAFYALFYALANFLWAVEDSLLVGNLQVATLAYIFDYIPAYLGVVFSVFMVKLRPKIIIPIASAIMGAAIVSFVLFPLEYELVGGIYVYYPTSITKWLLLAVAVMALTPVVVFLAYATEMKKLGDIKERNKGTTLAIGFLLMALGETVLVPYFKVPLILTMAICLVGIIALYYGFTMREKR
jgi:hypothetical protein